MLLLSTIFLSTTSLNGQCTFSSGSINQNAINACLGGCPAPCTIQITGNVSLNGDITITAQVTFEVTSTGNLTFGGNEELTLSNSGSILVVAEGGDLTENGTDSDVKIIIGGTNYTGGQFADIVAAGGADVNGVLPVELTHFVAQPKDNMIELAWATATELNNDFFQIEHSRDGIQFHAIGKVKGEGTTTETINYNFMHRQPISGTNYYRLKQVDFDGAYEYSDVVVAEINSRAGGVQIFPNPTINKAFIQMADLPEKVDFNLSTLLGQRLEVQPAPGDGGWELDLSNLPRGIYILQMNYDGKSVSKRLVKE